MDQAAAKTEKISHSLRKVSHELARLESLAQLCQSAFGEVLAEYSVVDGKLSGKLQQIDIVTQSLEGLTEFVDNLAEINDTGDLSRMDAAFASLKLRDLANRLSGEGDQGPVETVELF